MNEKQISQILLNNANYFLLIMTNVVMDKIEVQGVLQIDDFGNKYVEIFDVDKIGN